MPHAPANGIELYYETVGDPDDEPLLLIMGLGAQLVAWDRAFVEGLSARGFHIVLFDNRDVGLSTSFADRPPVDVFAVLGGDTSTLVYTLEDMAADAVGLLDHLGIESAHVVGASMGGMIAQRIAIDFPERVRSLCSIMSMTGGPDAEPPTDEALAVLLAPPPDDREAIIEASLAGSRVIGSPGFPFDEESARERAALAHDRRHDPSATARQLAAIVAAPDRAPALAAVRVPTVVIHGDSDPLVPPSGGHRTAGAVPGAELIMIEGMGHDLPQGVWGTIIDAITTNAAKAFSAS